MRGFVKFIYSEKATKFCEIFILILSTVHTDKSKVKILQNLVAFSEYMNFTYPQENILPARYNWHSKICSPSGNTVLLR